MPDDASAGPGGAQVTATRQRRLRPLLVPIVTLVVLWGLLELVAATRETHGRRMCRSSLCNAINYGCHLYASDFGDVFPPDLATLYPDFVSDGKVFLCPGVRKATPVEHAPNFSHDKAGRDLDYRRAVFGNTHTDFVYVSGLRPSDPKHYVLAFEDEWNHDSQGVNVLRSGGYAPSDRDWWPDIKALHEKLARQEKELAAQGRKMKILRPAWSSWPDPPPGGHPLWGLRPWHKRRGGRAVAVGALAAVAVALALIIRTVGRRRWKPGGPGNAR